MNQANIPVDIAEMKLAAAVQKALLVGDIPKCRCGKMVLKNRMSGMVGGDFYFFQQLGRDQAAFAIGDAVGHGISAALLMTLILGFLRADQNNLRRPSRLVGHINDQLVELGKQLHHPLTCSLIYGVVDLPTGILLYVNAGHPHPIICPRGSGKIQHLPPTTMLLGVQGGVLPESCHQFSQNDRLVLYTDGIIEARNHKADTFGYERLRQIVCQMERDPPDKLAERIFSELTNFQSQTTPEDDQTLAVIDFDRVSNGFSS